MPYIQNAATLIVETIFGIYLIFVILRFLFQLVRADFHNPISQVVVALTNPPLKLLRRFIPGVYGIDLSSIVLMLVVATAKVLLLLSFSGIAPSIAAAVVIGIAEILETLIWILIIAILASVIISWVAPGSWHPAIRMVTSVSEPVLAPFRRLLPSFGGLDFTPILALLLLNVLLTILVAPIMDAGRTLLF